MYYHRGGFVTEDYAGPAAPILLSHDIFTDLGATNQVYPNIRFTEDQHRIEVNDGGILELRGDLSGGPGATIDKAGTGTLFLAGNNQNYTEMMTLSAGTIRLGGPNALTSATRVWLPGPGTTFDLNNFDLAFHNFDQADIRANIVLGSGRRPTG